MFAKLLTLLSAVGVISLNAPIMVEKTIHYDNNDSVLKQRNYQHDVMINDYTKVTYKYESNEVNQESDLTIGNIYYIDFEDETIPTSTQRGATFTEVIFYKDVGQIDFTLLSAPQDGYIEMAWYSSGDIGFIVFNDVEHTYYALSTNILRFYGVLRNHDSRLGNLWQDFHYTDYNEILSVTYIQPTTIIGYINEFLENNLYSEIPYVRDITFNIGGEDINLLTWLIMLTGIFACGGFLFLMIKLFIWLFKIVSNSILLR